MILESLNQLQLKSSNISKRVYENGDTYFSIYVQKEGREIELCNLYGNGVNKLFIIDDGERKDYETKRQFITEIMKIFYD